MAATGEATGEIVSEQGHYTVELLLRGQKYLCTQHNLKLTRDTIQCRPGRNRHSQHPICSNRCRAVVVVVSDSRLLLREWMLVQRDQKQSSGLLTSHRCHSLLVVMLNMLLTCLTQPNWRRRC